jgi:hypothetical protein
MRADLPCGLEQMLDAPDWGSIDRTLSSWTIVLMETQRRYPRLYSVEETYENIGLLVSAAAARERELTDLLGWKMAARAEYYAERPK